MSAHPQVGKIYRFNQVFAKVIWLDERTVHWREVIITGSHRIKPRLKRTRCITPRWYFDQNASVTLHQLVKASRP